MSEDQNIQMDGGAYEIIRNRLQNHRKDLLQRLSNLNQDRKEIFGALDTKLIGSERISTENHCIAQDIFSLGAFKILGYNVHIGLRNKVKLSDVFSIYKFEEGRFVLQPIDLIKNEQFETSFSNLYKYYRDAQFVKFSVIDGYLLMVFQVSKNVNDIKVFKWLILDDSIEYKDDRSESLYRFPKQHEFKWIRAHRDMQRAGIHPHVSLNDKVFVETVGGDLTIKIEDNTDQGYGIYDEEVDNLDQTLDDAEYLFADLGSLMVIKIKPYQEDFRYFVYNHKVKEVKRIDTIADACILLPDNHGLIFSNGYYLQTGEYKIFDRSLSKIKFEKRIASSNGEDYLYVFFQPDTGLYILMSYNIIEQQVKSPIICNGYTLFSNGELIYFNAEKEATRHHTIQIWQTPYTENEIIIDEQTSKLIYKIGNKDIVKAMAECNEIAALINKDDSYSGLYDDIEKRTTDALDSYYWIAEKEAHELSVPLTEIKQTANAAISEFEKVRVLKKEASNEFKKLSNEVKEIFFRIKSLVFDKVDLFVQSLRDLRNVRGAIIAAKDIRYIDINALDALESQVQEGSQSLSEKCIEFLLREDALTAYLDRMQDAKSKMQDVKTNKQTKDLEEEFNQIANELELLIDIVTNLNIEDATHSTKIIDNITIIFAELNQYKSELKQKSQVLMGKEATAEFNAQLKLLDQAIINYLDLSDSPEKADNYLTKLMVQLEEVEGKYSEFDDFIELLSEKREEIYEAFESKRLQLVESRNKRTNALYNAAERIINGIENRGKSFKSIEEINSYFAADLMIDKIRKITAELVELEDTVKADDIGGKLKTVQEELIRKLKDKQDLYSEGEQLIQLGNHKFFVNEQALDITIVPRNDKMFYHLTGTAYFEEIENESFNQYAKYWNQSIISENENVYRAEYLAYLMYCNWYLSKDFSAIEISNWENEFALNKIRDFISNRYTEGYVKGIHDVDALKIFKALVDKANLAGTLKYSPVLRTFASMFWTFQSKEITQPILHQIKGSGYVQKVFPSTSEPVYLLQKISAELHSFQTKYNCFNNVNLNQAAVYIFEELSVNDRFKISEVAYNLLIAFRKYISIEGHESSFNAGKTSIKTNWKDLYLLNEQWLKAFVAKSDHKWEQSYITEAAGLLTLASDIDIKDVVSIDLNFELKLKGEHQTIHQGIYKGNIVDFLEKLTEYSLINVPEFAKYQELKKQLIVTAKNEMKLEEFHPKVLSSFVRNKLINQVYLPLFGENFAKQLGAAGEQKRSDRSGLLLLISPPGYGKTTLMEYIANRIGLTFIKVNGPALGHNITSLDPQEANNAAAREELKKLNLSLEFGDNFMLYIDDIQHCNPEFLQKFISLCDAQRKIEGVYKGKSKTYDFRGKKIAVVMAGNPYTESGDKFQVPDMLANRADIYNLGDIIGGSDELFKLSLIENALTNNKVTAHLSSKSLDDVYNILNYIETGNNEALQLKVNHTPQEIEEYVSVLSKIIQLREVVLSVNQLYIESAGKADEFRVEPSFKLQGSYRDMNKLVARISPIMNNEELKSIILSHYISESQTLTNGAEANLLKFKQLQGWMSTEEEKRWNEILEVFKKQQKLKGYGNQGHWVEVIDKLGDYKLIFEELIKVMQQKKKE